MEKADMFTINKRKWERVEDVAKEWIQDNWFRWEEESPAWFTEAWKSNIPDDWLTPEELSRQKLAGGGQRRRSSVGEMLGGSVRERRGRATVAPEVAVTGAEGDEEELFHDAQDGEVVASSD